MADEIDDMRKRVGDRVKEEAAAQAPREEEAPPITSKFLQDCLVANSLGDGTLYARILRDRFVYCKDLKEWFEWNGNFWQLDIMDRSLVAVEEVVAHYLGEYTRAGADVADLLKKGADGGDERIVKLKKLQDALLRRVSQLRDDKRRTACLKFAHTIQDAIAIEGRLLDLHPMLFPCANGVIDLETGRLRPGRPRDYLTMASPIPFPGIDTPAPLWERTLLEIFGGDSSKPLDAAGNETAVRMSAFMNRLFGCAMTGMSTEKIFPILYGKSGWNGRSRIVDAITHIMGDLAGPIQAEMLLSQKYTKSAAGPSPDIMTLKGLRMAFAAETDEHQRFSASKIKWLSGGDQLIGRWPNDKRPIRFDPTHTLFLATNLWPDAPPNDRSFWERVLLIPFNVRFVDRDPQESDERRANLNLGLQLVAEYPGILAWMVRGRLIYQRDGLNPPREVTDATEDYRRSVDLLADFIDQCCVREAAAKEKSSVLYTHFVEWYHENEGKKEPSGTWFGKQIHQKFERDKVNGCNVYLGIRLAENQRELET